MNSRRKEKLGNWALDIAKYIFTAVIIARWFKSDSVWKWYDYIIPLIVVIATVFLGLYWTDDSENEKKGK